jgi:hypothetical protein
VGGSTTTGSRGNMQQMVQVSQSDAIQGIHWYSLATTVETCFHEEVCSVIQILLAQYVSASRVYHQLTRFMATVWWEYSMSENDAENLKTSQYSSVMTIAPVSLASKEQMWMQYKWRNWFWKTDESQYEVADFTIMRMWKWLWMVANTAAWFLLWQNF